MFLVGTEWLDESDQHNQNASRESELRMETTRTKGAKKMFPEHFEIICSRETFKEMFQVICTQRDRKRKTLKSGWSSKLSSIIWEQKKLSCIWSWKRASVRSMDIVCKGSCSDCGATIECEATPKCLRFNIENFDPEFIHNPKKKRRVLKSDMPTLQALLDGKSVQKVRANLANDLMEFGDPEPPVLPNAGAMRQAKSKIDCPDIDPFSSLSFLQKKYPKGIHSIGYDPFFIISSLPLQQALYKGEAMRTKRATISIDSTGLSNLFSYETQLNIILIFISIVCRSAQTIEGTIHRDVHTILFHCLS